MTLYSKVKFEVVGTDLEFWSFLNKKITENRELILVYSFDMVIGYTAFWLPLTYWSAAWRVLVQNEKGFKK